MKKFKLIGICAGIVFISLQGMAQHALRHPSFPLFSAGSGNSLEYAADKSNIFSKADQHAINVSKLSYATTKDLSEALCASGLTEQEKIRSIYFWIAGNISYDKDMLTGNNFSSQVADSVFLHRKAVCEGFSNLFVTLCRLSGIEARIIIGYVKDDLYDRNKMLTAPNHAWNAVKIGREWHLLDVTWASFAHNIFAENENSKGHIGYKLESNFLIDPQIFVETHLPEDPYWQLLSRPVEVDAFFEGDFTVAFSEDVDVHKRIAVTEALEPLDREIAYCERMVKNDWNRFKEYRLGIAYYQKAQQLYSKIAQLRGTQRERMLESVNLYYEKSLNELTKLSPMDFGYEYSQDFINNITLRKDLLSYNF